MQKHSYYTAKPLLSQRNEYAKMSQNRIVDSRKGNMYLQKHRTPNL